MSTTEITKFLEVMAAVCTPVTVVTSQGMRAPHGTTVSAFGSLSLEPPLISVALDRGSDLLRIIKKQRRFGVNVLAHDQGELAAKFARKGTDKFAGVDYRISDDLPRIAGSSGWLVCRVFRLVSGGDHVIVFGLVETAELTPAAPLVYHERVFGTHSRFVEQRTL